MAAFFNCCLVEKNNLFTKTLKYSFFLNFNTTKIQPKLKSDDAHHLHTLEKKLLIEVKTIYFYFGPKLKVKTKKNREYI